MLLFALLVLIWLPAWLFVRHSFFLLFSVVCSFRFQFSILCLSFFFCCFNFDLSTCHIHTFVFFSNFIFTIFLFSFLLHLYPKHELLLDETRFPDTDHLFLIIRLLLFSFSSLVPLSLLSWSFSSHDRSQHSVRISKHVLSPLSSITYFLGLGRKDLLPLHPRRVWHNISQPTWRDSTIREINRLFVASNGNHRIFSQSQSLKLLFLCEHSSYLYSLVLIPRSRPRKASEVSVTQKIPVRSGCWRHRQP